MISVLAQTHPLAANMNVIYSIFSAHLRWFPGFVLLFFCLFWQIQCFYGT